MKKIIKSVLSLSFIVALAACTKEASDVSSTVDSTRHEFSVNIEAGAYEDAESTKANAEAVVRVNWEKGDKVSVINVTTGKLLGGQLVADESGSIVKFSGALFGNIEKNNTLVYVYPAIEENAAEKDFETTNNDLSSQTWSNTEKKVLFYGYAEDTWSGSEDPDAINKNIQFTFATSYLHLNMANLTKLTAVSNVTISNINGGFAWAIEEGKFKVKSYKENAGISVACTGVTASSNGNAIVRFALPVSDATSARTLSVNNTQTATFRNIAIASGKYFNYLLTSFTSKVTIDPASSSTSGNTEVTITDASTENVAASLPTSDSFVADNITEITVGGVGEVTFDTEATNKILENAQAESATSVYFQVENVTEKAATDENEAVYEITMKTVDETGTEVFSESKAAGTATVTVYLPNAKSINSVSLLVGTEKTAVSSYTWDETTHKLSFVVSHFSDYSIDFEPYDALVAKIGAKEYPTLTAAFAAVGEGETITLISNCETGSDYTIENALALSTKNVTIDLNGKSLTVTNNFSFILAADGITLKNGNIVAGAATGKQTGIISYSVTVAAKDNGKFVNGVTLDGLTVTGGIRFGGSANNAQYKGGATNGIVTDCTVTSGDYYCIWAQENSNATVKSGTYNWSKIYGQPINVDTGSTISLKGGVYNDNTNLASYCATGYHVKTLATDPVTYAVVEIPYVAQVVGSETTTKYTSLIDAFDKTAEGETLELLSDIDLTNVEWPRILFNKKTFDGKGYTISYLNVANDGKKMSGFIANGDQSTIKNLTIDHATVSGINHVGVIAGRGMCTYIENCTVTNSSVTSTVLNNDDGDKVGTICGYLSGEHHAWVKNCTAKNSTVTGYRDLGSIVGYADCYASGSAVISGNKAISVGVVCTTGYGTQANYKNYQTRGEFHAGQIVGELGTNAASGYSDNATSDVTVTYNPDIPDYAAKVVINKETSYYTDLADALNAAKASGATCTLLRDVDLTDVAWTPVADFDGTFDGGNYTISNLTVSGTGNLGLFANTLTSATIKDLTITGAKITSTSGSKHGVLAGSISGSTVTGVTIQNSTVSAAGGQYTGGMVGTGYPHVSKCTVENCTVTGYDQVGGLIGYQWVGYIENCTVTGNSVTATSERAGGLVGKVEIDSGNLGSSTMWFDGNTISAKLVQAPDYAGGIAGQIMGNVDYYSISNNTVDIESFGTTPTTNPIATLRASQNAAFTGALAKNITGNTWTDETLNADYFEYTNVYSGVAAQIISRVGFYRDEDGVYHISDLAGLKVFRDAVNANTTKTTEKPYIFKTATVQLDASIDMNNANWTPINCQQNGFGTFDGNNKTISNFVVPSSANCRNAGLFSAIGCGTVKNLTVENADVTGINQVAAIAGYGMCGTFMNCKVYNSKVTSVVSKNDKNEDDDGDKAGAICGYLTAEGSASVTGCYAEGCTITAYRDLGSIVGYAGGPAVVTGNTAKNCSIICKTDKNYKNYTTKAQFDANQLIGEIASSSATVSGNSAANVTVTYVPDFTNMSGTTADLGDWK